MTNLTEAFDTAVKKTENWINGEISWDYVEADVYMDLGEVDQNEFEALIQEYLDFAYDEEKMIMTLMLQDSDGYACLGNQV